MLTPLNLPTAHLKLTRKKGVLYVWCVIRRKHLQLTPEEWVRQHLIHFLISHKQVSIGRIASEVTLQVGELTRRCDLLIVGEDGKPVLLIEVKAPDVPIGSNVMHQIAHYNRVVGAEYLVLSNGIQHLVVRIDQKDGEIELLNDLPDFL